MNRKTTREIALIGIITFALSMFLIFGVCAVHAEALTGNIDVDKAIPDINNAIENMKPYEPTPWERFLWFIKDIFEGWWKP